MKWSYFTLLFCCCAEFAFCQTEGDYRTRVNGQWNGPSAWQVFHNGGWRNVHAAEAGPFLNVTPTFVSGRITVRHLMTIASNLPLNNTIIQANAQVRINAGVNVILVDDFTDSPLQVNVGGLLTNFGTMDLQSQLSVSAAQVHGEFLNSGLIQVS